jgi:hypothetical protein
MSMIPANEIERFREEVGERSHVCVTTSAHVIAAESVASLREIQGRANVMAKLLSKREDAKICATVVNSTGTAQPGVARSVRDGLASSDTTPGKPPFAQRGARTGSRPDEKMIGGLYLEFRLLSSKPGGELRGNFREDLVFEFAPGDVT